jgi:hypothetical protein
VLGLIVATAAGGAYLAVDRRGYARCERDFQLDALHAAEESHQYHLAEIARGDAISAELSKTQRRLNETKSEYLAYAGAIAGHCPADLGLLLAAESTPGSLPAAPGASADATLTLDASAIAENIAENRFRFEVNYATCAALIEWHGKEVLK